MSELDYSEGAATDRPSDSMVRRGLRWLDQNVEIYLILIFYLYIILVVGIEVFRRFALDQASLWGEETARMAFIYLTWIGVSWGVHKRTHIRIDFIHDLISERLTGIFYIISDLSLLAFAYYAITLTLPVIQTSLEFGATTPALRVSRVYFLMAIPLGFVLVIIRSLQALYRDTTAVLEGRPVFKGGTLFAEDENDESESVGL
jgi:TRAP-type C4-dicarboxylate transport system permease small subunit